ncbi:MAG: YbhB/YbcL family Raf kinase inhibitor-like protein [Candidatus Hydrogenedentota bacterium]
MNSNHYRVNAGWMHFGVIVLGLTIALGCQKTEAPSEAVGSKTETPTPMPASVDEPEQEGGNSMSLEISSSAFDDQGTIPREHTADGQDVSPPLSWSGVPEGTQSLALVCDDPDAPVGTWVHWVIWNIPAGAGGLDEAVPPQQRELPNGAVQGTNDFKKIGYGGPAPPRGPAHRYFFKLYALDTSLDLAPGAKKDELEKAMQGHILAEAQLVGQYGR